mgnify:CR=1 FL=1
MNVGNLLAEKRPLAASRKAKGEAGWRFRCQQAHDIGSLFHFQVNGFEALGDGFMWKEHVTQDGLWCPLKF